MNRTDIHKPSAIKPEDYEFVAMEHMKMESLLGYAFVAVEREKIQQHMKMTGGFYSQHEHGGNCMICGACCIYTALFYHAGTNTYVRVGTICAEKLGFGDPNCFKSFRRACTEALQNRAGKAKAEQFLREEELGQAWGIYLLDLSDFPSQVQWEVYTIRDIVSKLVKYGSLSQKQIDFVKKLVDRVNKWPEIEAQRKAEKEAADNCPEGRIQIIGTIVSIKEQDTNFGLRLVTTVKDDRGFLVWGTLPRIFNSTNKGDKVQFTAAVTPSDSDPKFGFFKRPTKAEVIEKKEKN